MVNSIEDEVLLRVTEFIADASDRLARLEEGQKQMYSYEKSRDEDLNKRLDTMNGRIRENTKKVAYIRGWMAFFSIVVTFVAGMIAFIIYGD